jgi:hypothetical protein
VNIYDDYIRRGYAREEDFESTKFGPIEMPHGYDFPLSYDDGQQFGPSNAPLWWRVKERLELSAERTINNLVFFRPTNYKKIAQFFVPRVVYNDDVEAEENLLVLDEVPEVPDIPAFLRDVTHVNERTNVRKVVSNLVQECKLDIVFNGYSEANYLVVQRWINRRLLPMKEKGMRMKHMGMVKAEFMALIFVPTSEELHGRRLFASRPVQERLAESSTRHLHFVWNSSTWFMPWFRKSAVPSMG